MSSRELERLPPRPAVPETADQAEARQRERERRDAQVRGVTSIAAMREAIKRASSTLPPLRAVPRVRVPDGAAFRQRAREGLPFLITGLVGRWPLSALTPQDL